MKSRLFKEVHQVPADFRLLMTGTPLQNNTTELWPLLHFIAPAAFNSMSAFLARFGNLETAEQVRALQVAMLPYLIRCVRGPSVGRAPSGTHASCGGPGRRRQKEEVEKSIPKKEETIVDVELTMLQKSYYRAIYEKVCGVPCCAGGVRTEPLTEPAISLQGLRQGQPAAPDQYRDAAAQVLQSPVPYRGGGGEGSDDRRG